MAEACNKLSKCKIIRKRERIKLLQIEGRILKKVIEILNKHTYCES